MGIKFNEKTPFNLKYHLNDTYHGTISMFNNEDEN